MPSQKNLNSVKNLQEKLQKAKSIVLADYKGLTVNQQRKLRNKVKAVAGELIVAKNNLLKIALTEEKFKLSADFDKLLAGPTITLLAYEDEIAPIKALAEFAKEFELPKIKLGFLTKEPLTGAQVTQLASLPTRLELIAKTVGSLKSPLNGIVNVLAGSIKKLMYVLSAIGGREAVKSK